MRRFLVRPKACHEKISDGPGAWLIPVRKIPPLNVLRVQSGEYFSAQYNLFIPACHEKGLFGRFSVLSGVIRLISEPPRTEYSGEPEMSRFLSRKGAFRKFREIWATSLSRKEQYPPEHTTGTVQGGFFHSE